MNTTMMYDNNWIAGLIDGAGTFLIYDTCCRFRLGLLRHDKELLEGVSEQTGLGTVHEVKVYGTTKPRYNWAIQSKGDCSGLARFLDDYPLRTHKQERFLVWRRAVSFWTSDEGTVAERREALSYLSRVLAC